MVQQNIFLIYNKFLEIKEKGWIKTMRTGSTGIGYTFECLINKVEDAKPLPDYYGFEIKTIRRNSSKKVHLFNLTPENTGNDCLRNLLNNLGYPSKSNPRNLAFCVDINGKEFRNIGYYKKAKIYVNYEKERVELIAYKNDKKLDLNIFWSFDYIKRRLYQKLKFLCVIEAENKFIDNV